MSPLESVSIATPPMVGVTSPILVITPPGPDAILGQLLEQTLSLAGVSNLMLLTSASLSATGIAGPAPFVISLACTEDAHFRVEAFCRIHDLVWLRCSFHADRGCADIGPTFSTHTPCLRCTNQLHPPPDFRTKISQDASAQHTWVALISLSIQNARDKLTADPRFRRYSIPIWTSVDLCAGSFPGCALCLPHSMPAQLSLASLFEQYMAGRKAKTLTGTAQHAYEALCTSLSRQFKSLPAFRTIRLEPGIASFSGHPLERLHQPSVTSNAPLTLSQLALVLRLIAGLRKPESPGKISRWAATGGNLGSVELFVLTRGLNGLASGIYFYQARQHGLVYINRRSGPPDVDSLIRLLAPASPDAEIVLCFTSAYDRLHQKYGPFAYKLSHLDAGTSLAQLHFIARSTGLFCRTQLLWPDDLIEQICGLKACKEHVTAVAALSSPAPASLPSAACPLGPDESSEAEANRSIEELTTLLYRQSRTSLSQLSALSEQAFPPRNQTTPTHLPPIGPRLKSPSAVLSQRRSARTFSLEPVTPSQLSTMLFNAVTADTLDFPDGLFPEPNLQMLVFARRVAGLTPAVFLFDPQTHSLTPVAALPSPAQQQELFNGADFTSAAVVIWICGDLQAATARDGSFGHRRLLLRAGAAAQRLWLSAIASSLTGATVAGIRPLNLARALGIDFHRRVGLVAFVAGCAPSSELGTQEQAPA